ncbi:MAG: c-type cytochrome [Actinomycetota bacterium]
MTGLVELSGPAIIGLFVAGVAALAFVGAVVLLVLRRRGPAKPDIPPAMSPGPADEVLERRHLEKVMGWGIVFVLFFAAWIPVVWILEPSTNVDDEIELVDRGVERGSRWFALADEENPTGFSCARCHGVNAQGGEVAFQGAAYPVPALVDVCGRLTIEGAGQIRETIMQGREGTPMPSWSVRFEGPMNDQQIQDLINYLVSIQTVPQDQNLCLDPSLAEEEGA